MLEKVLDVKETALTEQVRAAVDALKREAAKSRGPVKKATGYSFAIIRELIAREILPFEDRLGEIDAIAFRSLCRAVIIYCTFCRFDDFKRLTDREVTDEGDHIKIVFLRSKNDQFGDNSISVIPVRGELQDCPAKIIRLYFRRFGLKFGGGGKLLNFRLRRIPGGHVAMPHLGLAASNATKCTRILLEKYGYEASKFTEKSMKVQGVTELLDVGEPLENVMTFGRWRTTTTPLHYRNLSTKYRLKVANNIPL